MAKDFIKDYKVNVTGVVILEEFYQYIKNWFDHQGYGFDEPSYRELQQGKKKTIMIRWTYDKKYNDYIKQKIDINLAIKDAEEVKTKKKTAYQATIEMAITCYLDKDYEGTWENNKITKLLREIYDKFASNLNEMQRSSDELKKDGENFYNEIKAYLHVTQ
ncbi:MAG TPA: hypothetical protein VJB87_04090 [Candidatus Nanoarchaeia archaeon]|nr:hypothetical protein [Candidatus Nanoarchaeia archaeon]